MKIVLAAAAMLGMTASLAFAECGHDSVKAETTQSVATLDTSTTASTTPVETGKDEAKPVQTD